MSDAIAPSGGWRRASSYAAHWGSGAIGPRLPLDNRTVPEARRRAVRVSRPSIKSSDRDGSRAATVRWMAT